MSKDSSKLTQSSLSFVKPLKRKRDEEEPPADKVSSLHHENPAEGVALDKELENLPKPNPKCRKISQESAKVLSEKNTNAETPDDHSALKKSSHPEAPEVTLLKEVVASHEKLSSSLDEKDASVNIPNAETPEADKESELDVSMAECPEPDTTLQDTSLDQTDLKDESSEADENSACDISHSPTSKSLPDGLPESKPDEQNDSEHSLNRTLSLSPGGNLSPGSQRLSQPRKRRMNSAEATAKALEREKRLKEKEEAALQKKLLQEKKQAEKEEKLKERQKKKEQEEKEKQEKIKQKEEKTKAKLEEKKKREEERKKKEEEKKKKDEDKKKKEEEKKKKEEEKKKKEEEKKKKEEERKKKEEEKQKKDEEKEKNLMKTKEAFVKFFLKPQSTPKSKPQVDTATVSSPFLPFQVQKNMTLAPVVPTVAVDRFKCEPLDHYLEQQDDKANYLQDLRDCHHLPHTHSKPACCQLNPDIPQYRAKLLQFCENVRPPYWGTWRKKSKFISPKNPFKEDKDLLDYEVDSDEEWDEGGPGESLEGTDDEKESGGEEDGASDVDDFIVPHGYLSAEEEEEDEPQEVDHERMKEELKLREKGFYKEIEAERRKISSMKPFVVGCLWQCEPGQVEEHDGEFLLSSHSAVLIELEVCTPTLFPPSTPLDLEGEFVLDDPSQTEDKRPKKKLVSEAAMPHLIRLFHGNNNSRVSLIKEFVEFWKTQNSEDDISRRQLSFKIQEIGVWNKDKPACWAVKEEVREKYGLKDLPLTNTWNYITFKPRSVASSASTSPRAEEEPEVEEDSPPPAPLSAASTPSIRKFIKVTPRSPSTSTPPSSSKPDDDAMDVI